MLTDTYSVLCVFISCFLFIPFCALYIIIRILFNNKNTKES